MSRTALVRNGIVEHVVIAGSDYSPPSGMTAVSSRHANIGDLHDGINFKPPVDPDLPTPQLIEQAKRRRQLLARMGVMFNVGTADSPLRVRVSTTREARSDLDDHAYLAEHDQFYRGTWVDDFGVVELSGAQFIELQRQVALYVAETYKTLGRTVAEINSGVIRKKSQIEKIMMPTT